MRERERGGDRDRETETERERERARDRDRDRDRDTERVSSVKIKSMNRVRAGQHIKIYCFYNTGVITSLMFAVRFASSISNFRKGGQAGRQAGRRDAQVPLGVGMSGQEWGPWHQSPLDCNSLWL